MCDAVKLREILEGTEDVLMTRKNECVVLCSCGEIFFAGKVGSNLRLISE